MCTGKLIKRHVLRQWQLERKNGQGKNGLIIKRTGINCFWIIDNSEQVLSALNKINHLGQSILIV